VTKHTPSSGIKIVATNKKARFNYFIEERFEAGIVLTGAEIKSIREGSISLDESYIAIRNNEIFLLGAHVKRYAFNADPDYDPMRRRKLLMHRQEIDRLRGKVDQRGLTLIPTKVYLKNGRAKVEVGLAKGKVAPDKRKTIKDREMKREAERAMKTKS